MSALTIRPGTRDDVPAIAEIYNHYVRETPITFDLEPFSLENRIEWFRQFTADGPHRIVVAEQDAVVAGYAYSTRVRPRAAYDTSVEVTIYVRPDAKRNGIGHALYGQLFDLLADADVHRAYAVITLPNEASVRIHETFGFRHMGTMHEVGRKFENYWDVAWYEKPFS